jgi:hypothetical protein
LKRILYLALAVVFLTACKKSEKEEVITIDTLIGTWQEQLPPGSSVYPASYTFRKDSTFTSMSGGFVGTIQGTFRANAAVSSLKVIDLTLITIGGLSPRFTIEFKSTRQMLMAYGATLGTTFVRVQ